MRVGAGHPAPGTNVATEIQYDIKQGGETPPLRYPTLGQIVGYFKYQTTKRINVVAMAYLRKSQ